MGGVWERWSSRLRGYRDRPPAIGTTGLQDGAGGALSAGRGSVRLDAGGEGSMERDGSRCAGDALVPEVGDVIGEHVVPIGGNGPPGALGEFGFELAWLPSRVAGVDPKTGEVYTSGPSDSEGNYELTNVPASTYEVAVEADGGLYLVQSPLKLAPGQMQSVNLAVNAQMADDPAAEQEKTKRRGGTGVWNNPATAALIVIGAAVVLGLLIDAATDDDDDQPSSPN